MSLVAIPSSVRCAHQAEVGEGHRRSARTRSGSLASPAVRARPLPPGAPPASASSERAAAAGRRGRGGSDCRAREVWGPESRSKGDEPPWGLRRGGGGWAPPRRWRGVRAASGGGVGGGDGVGGRGSGAHLRTHSHQAATRKISSCGFGAERIVTASWPRRQAGRYFHSSGVRGGKHRWPAPPLSDTECSWE